MKINKLQANWVVNWWSVLQGFLVAVVLGVVLADASNAQAPTKCDPTKACCREDTIGGDPKCVGAGNPIDVVTGNKYQREEDLPALPGLLGIEIVRHYNSAYSRPRDGNGLLGRGWRLSYEIDLMDKGERISIVQADGTPVQFVKGMLEPQVYVGVDPALGRVSVMTSGREREYVWRRLDGRELGFDARGKLTHIKLVTGEFVSLTRDSQGMLQKVTDPQGRTLVFHYLDNKSARTTDRFRGIQTIDTPVGRFEYEYGKPPSGAKGEALAVVSTLVKVTLPGRAAQRASRLYHYEDQRFPTLLTGISIAAMPDGKEVIERIATYGYDAQGRGNLTVRGVPARYKTGTDGKRAATPEPGTGIEQVTLDFSELGKTVATNSLGQRTVFTYRMLAGRERLVEARGAGCAHCPGPNERYGYDKFGRLSETSKLTVAGEPLQTLHAELDDQGRPQRIERIVYVQSKAQPAQLLARYEYGLWPQPRLIARPSVVLGKEHLIRVRYNDFGQPLQVIEEGFSPLDEQGQPGASSIQRSVTYGYSSINGRSVLTEIDGPLPNGPKGTPEDSDITKVEYDDRGSFVTAMTPPMNLRRSFVRDSDTGRLVTDTGPDGIATRYRYDTWAAGPTAVERAGRMLHYTYDAVGRLAGISDAPGHGMQLHYDSAARLVSLVDAQGYKAQTTLDSEGQALVSGLYEPGHDKPLRATYRWFDEQHRLVRQLRADGRIDDWQFAQDGRWVRHDDGDQVLNLHGLGGPGNAQSMTISLASDGQVRANLARTDDAGADTPASRRDDFGRTVASWLPGQGLRQWRFDAADHLLAQTAIDRTMQPAHATRWRYDAAGRLIERVNTDAQGHAVLTLSLRYDGARLVEEADDAQIRRLEYDEAGRVVRTVLEIKDAQGRKAYATTFRASFDVASGELSTRTLADGRVMLVTRTVDSQVARSISVQTPFWFGMSQRIERWLPASWAPTVQGWLPRQMIVTDIGFHPYNGITGYTHGNGIQTRKSFDIAGRLTSLNAAGNQPVLAQTLRYGVGPRIAGIEDAANTFKGQFQYTGFGELKLEAPQMPQLPQKATVPRVEFDTLGRVVNDGTYRYTYTVRGQVAGVSRPDGTLVASYRYNAGGQRVSKTLASGQVTYYLWQDGRLVAEVLGGQQGAEVAAQYLYLGDQGLAAPVAKLEGEHAEGNASGAARVLFIHANHRAEPVAMTDEHQAVVWRAQPDEWGYVKASSQQPATINLRLPGQYFDAETALHDNWHRTYDPRPDSPWRGRYLSPDPLGFPDGPDPYRYVNGDPVNRVDPFGLYQIDVHYYATFFMALAAGVDKEEARVIALATQYIDENPLTRPMLPHVKAIDYTDSILVNKPALVRYHFTQEDYDPPRTAVEAAAHLLTGGDLNSYIKRRVANPDNPQLQRLMTASDKAPTRCAQLQFFGEYLHAFEDTFAHRDKQNNPYSATMIGLGGGHGLGGENPDYTYNHFSKDLLGFGYWGENYDRTMEMEKEVFAKMSAFADPKAFKLSWKTIEYTMEQFTKFEAKGDSVNLNDKLNILNTALKANGFDADLLLKGKDKFNESFAETNRDKFLGALKAEDYPGTILPSGDMTPLPKK